MGVQLGFLSSLSRASCCLAYFFCVGILGVFPGIALAQFAPSGTYTASEPWGLNPVSGSSHQGVCDALAAKANEVLTVAWKPVTATAKTYPNGQLYCDIRDKDGAAAATAAVNFSASCPPNSRLSGGQCICNAGFDYVSWNKSCMPVDEGYCLREGINATIQGRLGWGWISGRHIGTTVYCDTSFNPPGGAQGCIMGFDPSMAYQVDGEWRTAGDRQAPDHGPYACSPADPILEPPKIPQKPDQPDTCKPPMVAGYVNGQVHCYTPSDKNPMETKPTTRTEREVKDNGDGTRTETTRTITTTTSCTGGSCNTVTTTTTNTQIINNSDNSVINNTTTTGESESTNPFDGFCKANPGSRVCGQGGGEEGSSWGGSCGAGFQCKGDAIQCAMARDQHLRNCQAFEPQGTEEESIYNAGKSKYGTNQTGDNPNNETIDLGFVIDQSDAIGGGTSGMSDLTVTVWNNTVTLPFSQVNQYLGWLGNLLVAVSLLLAVRIVTRG